MTEALSLQEAIGSRQGVWVQDALRDIIWKFFTLTASDHWNNFPRDKVPITGDFHDLTREDDK